MRAGLGLVGLLICIGVVVWIMGKSELPHTQAVLAAKKKAEDTMNPIAGYSRDGSMKFSDSLQIEPETKGGKISAIDVTSVVAGGPAATEYGLKENDVIVEIGPLSVKDQINSAGEARDMIQDAYQRNQPLVILRDGNKMTLSARAKPQSAAKTVNNASNKAMDETQQEINVHSLPGMP
jgi:C-terminal processing protease CtpA/Prc